MNFYPFHIGDYLSATRHLSWDEDAAYRRLLDAYYTSEKPLPRDERQVFRLVVATTEAQREAVRVVLQEFFTLTEDGYKNSRADREIDVMKDKQEKQRAKANRRWDMHRTECGTPTAMPRHEVVGAAAQNDHANAMPPIPIPILNNIEASPQAATPSTKPAAQGTRLPNDWELPDDWRKWAESNRPDLDAGAVAESFRDFWIAKPGKDGRKADWQATWRNWVRSQKAQHGAILRKSADVGSFV